MKNDCPCYLSCESSGTRKETFREFCFHSESCIRCTGGCCCYGWFGFHVSCSGRKRGKRRKRSWSLSLVSSSSRIRGPPAGSGISFLDNFSGVLFAVWSASSLLLLLSGVAHVSFTDHVAGGRGELLIRRVRLCVREPHNGHLPAASGGGAAARRSRRQHPDHRGLRCGRDRAAVIDIWTLDAARRSEIRKRTCFVKASVRVSLIVGIIVMINLWFIKYIKHKYIWGAEVLRQESFRLRHSTRSERMRGWMRNGGEMCCWFFKNKGEVESCDTCGEIKLMSHTTKLWERNEHLWTAVWF